MHPSILKDNGYRFTQLNIFHFHHILQMLVATFRTDNRLDSLDDLVSRESLVRLLYHHLLDDSLDRLQRLVVRRLNADDDRLLPIGVTSNYHLKTYRNQVGSSF